MPQAGAWSDEDKKQLLDLLDQGISRKDIGKKLGRSPNAIKAAVHRWHPATRPAPKRTQYVCPPDLAERWREMSLEHLQVHYDIPRDPLRRFVAALGLRREPGVVCEGVAAMRKAEPTTHEPVVTTRPVHPPRDYRASAAAAVLRRIAPITRCNNEGQFAPGGAYWRRGSAILTDAEVVERAEAIQRRAAA